jgi:hypothetical protein
MRMIKGFPVRLMMHRPYHLIPFLKESCKLNRVSGIISSSAAGDHIMRAFGAVFSEEVDFVHPKLFS